MSLATASALVTTIPAIAGGNFVDPHIRWWKERNELFETWKNIQDGADEMYFSLPDWARKPSIALKQFTVEGKVIPVRFKQDNITEAEHIDNFKRHYGNAYASLKEKPEFIAHFDAAQKELEDLKRQAAQLCAPADAEHERADELCDIWHALDERIANTPAQTLGGVLVQLRLLAECKSGTYEAVHAKNMLATVENLAGAA